VYRHWDGYPSAVLPDLLAFLQWSTRGGDIEYETANFLYWSKQGLGDRSVQLGFGVCANDELHGDVEYFYVVEHTAAGTVVRAYTVEYDEGRKSAGWCRRLRCRNLYFLLPSQHGAWCNRFHG